MKADTTCSITLNLLPMYPKIAIKKVTTLLFWDTKFSFMCVVFSLVLDRKINCLSNNVQST